MKAINWKKLQAESIKHYDRMIEFVERTGITDSLEMFEEIKESWFGESCEYCCAMRTETVLSCYLCKLKDKSCCGGLWDSLFEADKKGDKDNFLFYLKAIKEYIKEKGA